MADWLPLLLGSITSLQFQDRTHLLSASDDGTICIWRTSDWECLKILKGHKWVTFVSNPNKDCGNRFLCDC